METQIFHILFIVCFLAAETIRSAKLKIFISAVYPFIKSLPAPGLDTEEKR